MRPNDLLDLLVDIIPSGMSVIVYGPPGVGKSHLINTAIERLKRRCIEWRPALHDPVDAMGCPTVVDGQTHWARPAAFPDSGNDVLFLDEIGQCSPAMQVVCAQLLWEKKAGTHELPDGCAVIAATNRQEDRAGANRLLTQLSNRCVHIDLDIHNEDWHDWAINNNIAPEVRSFLKFMPSKLHDFKPELNERAFASPRSWSFASKIIEKVPERLLLPTLEGTIGKGAATEFIAHMRIYRSLPDPMTVIKNPTTATIPTEPSVMWALMTALAQHCKDGDKNLHDAVGTYANRLPNEFAACLIKDAQTMNVKFSLAKSVDRWVREHRDFFMQK